MLWEEVKVSLAINDSQPRCFFIKELAQILVDGNSVRVVYYIKSCLTEKLHQLILRVIHQCIDGEVM